MTKYTPIKLTQLSSNESAAVDAINRNLDAIKESIDDSISRSAKTPSQLTADLDLNGHKILNTGTPSNPTDLVRQQDVVADKAEIKQMHDDVMVTGERILNAAEVTDEKVQEAADAAALAEQWATKTDGPVADGEYSAKYYAEQIGADVATVAAIAEDVSAVADNETDISAVAGNISNVNAVADNETNINAVNSNKTNIDTVATNMSDIETCVTNMSVIQDAPIQAANAAASAEQAAISAAATHFKLFHHDWFDYQLDDMAWLRADTFSWHDGIVYSNAYNHLVDDYTNHSIPQKYIYFYNSDWIRDPENDVVGADHPYAWTHGSSTEYTDTETPTAGADGDKHYYAPDSAIGGEIASVGEYAYHTETIGSYTIQYYLAEDGHKIVMPDQETTVQNIYNESGVAWYYVLDTTNQRFKLPRTKYGFTGLRDSVGNYVPESLPNITGEIPDIAIRSSTGTGAGAFSSTEYENSAATGASNRGVKILKFNASDSSSTYQDSAPVQQRATQQYLYFYVGQFSQSATEQTAGLNSELFNGKMDRDMSNMNPSSTAKETIVGWGMPDYSAKISVSFPYTAPSDGYCYIDATDASFYLYIDGVEVHYQSDSASGLNSQTTFIPICKSQQITTSNNNVGLSFVPLKGV